MPGGRQPRPAALPPAPPEPDSPLGSSFIYAVSLLPLFLRFVCLIVVPPEDRLWDVCVKSVLLCLLPIGLCCALWISAEHFANVFSSLNFFRALKTTTRHWREEISSMF